MLEFDVKKYLENTNKKKSKKKKSIPIEEEEESILPFQCIILDMSMINDIDPSGAEFLEEFVEMFSKVQVEVVLAGIKGHYLT